MDSSAVFSKRFVGSGEAGPKSGGIVEVRINNPEGPVIRVIVADNQRNIVKAPVKYLNSGVQNLIVSLSGDKPVEMDWLSFK